MGCSSSVPAAASAVTAGAKSQPAAPPTATNSSSQHTNTASVNAAAPAQAAEPVSPTTVVASPPRQPAPPRQPSPPAPPQPETADDSKAAQHAQSVEESPPAPLEAPSDQPPASTPLPSAAEAVDEPPAEAALNAEPDDAAPTPPAAEHASPEPPARPENEPPPADSEQPDAVEEVTPSEAPSPPPPALRTALPAEAAATLSALLNPLPLPANPNDGALDTKHSTTIDSLLQWILGQSHGGQRLAWLSGPPGGSVHSICLQLAMLGEEPSRGFTILRHHVGSATGGAYTDPVHIIRSLAFQLVSAFGEQLAGDYASLDAKAVSGFGHPRDALDALLAKPLAKVCPPSAAPVVILLEGLDPPPSACNHSPLETSVLLLARALLANTPQHAMLLLATSDPPERTDKLATRLADLSPMRLEPSPEEAGTLRDVLGAAASGVDGVEGPVSAYLANSGASPDELTPLLLPLLLAAREPLPLSLLNTCGASADALTTHLPALFPVTDDNNLVAPVDPAVVRFFLSDSAGEWRVDVAAGHAALAAALVEEATKVVEGGGGETPASRYCLRNGLHHCMESGAVSLDSLAGDVCFWQRCFEAVEESAAKDLLRSYLHAASPSAADTLDESSMSANVERSAGRLLSSHAMELAGNSALTPLRAFDSPLRSHFAVAMAASPPDGQLLSRPAQWTRQIRSLEGHSRMVNAVAVSSDGRLAASGSDDCTVRLWDVAMGVEVAALKAHTDEVTSVAFSPNGATVASGSWDGDVVLWDAASGARLATLKGHNSGVTAVEFVPPGKLLLSSSDDKTVRFWDTVSGECTSTVSAHAMTVTAVAVSADGTLYATGSEDTTVGVWDATSQEERHCLERHASAVHALAISPDGKLLASGGWDKLLCLWDLSSGELLLELPHPSAITGVAFSSDGTRVLSSAGKTVWVRRVDNGEVADTLGGGDRQGEITCLSLPGDNGRHLITGSRDTTLGVWDVGTPPRSTDADVMHTDVVTAVAPLPNGHTVASSSWDKTVILWDVDGAANAAVRLETGHGSGVTALAISADGKYLVTGSDDRTLKVWRLGGGMPEEAPALLPDSLLPEGMLGFTALACMPSAVGEASDSNGLLVVSGGKDKLVRLWRLVEGEGVEPSVSTLAEHSRMVTSVAMSHDGALVASSSKDGKVIVSNTAATESTQTFTLPSSGIMQVAFSPDSTLLAAACEVGKVAVCGVSNGEVQRELTGHNGPVNCLAFSPDGNSIVTGGKDATVALWRVSTGERVKACVGHKRAITSVAFSFDGSSVVSGSEDRDIRMWQAQIAPAS